MPSLPLVVVLSAGNSKRFKDAGIDTPKGLIKFSYLENDDSCTMIENVLPEGNFDWAVVATDQTYEDYFGDDWVIRIESSKGQADTLRQACEQITELSGDRSILVLNNDIKINYPLDVFCEQCKWANAGVLVFESMNTAYSYVNDIPLFKLAYEKMRASPWAIAGAYYFRSSRDLAKAVEYQMQFREPHAGEYYLSGTMVHIEGPKLAVVMEPIQFINWGTPEDLARSPDIEIEDPKIEAILATMR